MMQVKNRKAVSAWLRNFQMYSRARIHYDNLYVDQMAQKGVIVKWDDVCNAGLKPASSPSLPKAAPMLKAQVNSPLKTEGWINIEDTVSQSEVENLKRPVPPSSSSKAQQDMTVEADPVRVQQLQTQIAILQRELAQHTKVPSDPEAP